MHWRSSSLLCLRLLNNACISRETLSGANRFVAFCTRCHTRLTCTTRWLCSCIVSRYGMGVPWLQGSVLQFAGFCRRIQHVYSACHHRRR